MAGSRPDNVGGPDCGCPLLGGDDGESHATPLAAPSAGGANPLAALTTDTGECALRSDGKPCSPDWVILSIAEFIVSSDGPGEGRGGRPDDDPGGGTTGGHPAASAKPTKASANTADAKSAKSAKPAKSAVSAKPAEAASAVLLSPKPAAAEKRKIISIAAEILGCSSEACVVAHPALRSHVASGKGRKAARALELELEARFKPLGPRDSTQLLSNFNIDGVLQRWAAAEFPRFFNFDFNMMDFERTGGSLATTDVARILEGEAAQIVHGGEAVRRPCDTFACVLNTDVSSGRGKHWVAVFGDCRGRNAWSVEYFNSAGNPPPGPVARWLEETTARLTAHRAARPRSSGVGPVNVVALTNVRHQNSQTECGLYALFFIRRRLEGAPHSEFTGARISDAAMTEFRKHLFRGPG